MKSSVAAAAFDALVSSFETTDSSQSEGSREQNGVYAKLAREQTGLVDKTYEEKRRKKKEKTHDTITSASLLTTKIWYFGICFACIFEQSIPKITSPMC